MQLCIENVDQAGGCAYGYSCVYTDTISWASPTEPLPMIRDPRLAFDLLFGADRTVEQCTARRRVRRSVLDFITSEVSSLERDHVRLRAAYESTNRNPLGACALAGTGFSIDRDLTSDLLGFSGPTGNTYGSIATVDYLLESTSAAAVALAGLGRVVQDLLLWCTAELDYLRLSDGFVQNSSIMPQKRNPVAWNTRAPSPAGLWARQRRCW